jgi:hypothetical protein
MDESLICMYRWIFFRAKQAVSRTISSKVRGPCVYTEYVVKIFEDKRFLPICYTLLSPGRSNLGEKFITEIIDSRYPEKGFNRKLFA